MTILRHELEARCSPERVWALLADLEAVQRYNPAVRAAAIEGPQRAGIGAKRVCDLRPRGRVVERVTHWTEKARSASKWPRATGRSISCDG